MVKESTTVRLYVDGVEFISTTSFANNVPSGSNYLGSRVLALIEDLMEL